MCPNNNFALNYVLANKVNNEIHNHLKFTILLVKICNSIYLFEPKLALLYSKIHCTGPDEAAFKDE